MDHSVFNQGPRNLYRRDGKATIFRPTYDDLMCSKCTKLYIFAPIF